MESVASEPYVFVSYASPDRARVLHIVERLQTSDIRIWIDESSIPGGSAWSEEIARAVRGCAAMVLMCSVASLQSDNVHQEIQLAWKSRRPYVPLRLDASPIPEQLEYFLEGWQFIDIRDLPESEWLPRVVQALRVVFAVASQGGIMIPGASASSRSAILSNLTNLPSQVSHFIGRERELDELKGALSEARMVTLTGTGGAGKTRLALQLATTVLPKFRDGIWLVDLAPINDGVLVVPTVAKVLSVSPEAGRPILDSLLEYTRQKQMLLILDNCEHLLQSCAHLAIDILQACPGVRILATSRAVLGVSGERSWRVPSLSRPDPPPPPVPLARLTQFDAVRLLIDRAIAVQPDFAVTNSNAPAVAELCSRLEGIPLAIELAAAWLSVLSVEQIDDQLDHRFSLLASDNPLMPVRHQTLRAAIDWSYDLLTPGEQTLFRRLSVFRGGFALDAMQAVCAQAELDPYLLLRVLLALTNKSLVQRDERTTDSRFRMLETIREYGLERLTASGEADLRLLSQAEYFSTVVAKAKREMKARRDRSWWDQIEIEHDNIRAALDTLIRFQHVERALALASAMGRFWLARGYLQEGRMRLAAVLAISETQPVTATRIEAIFELACIAYQQGDLQFARARGWEMLAASNQLDDKVGQLNGLTVLGLYARSSGDFKRAQEYASQSLKIARHLEDSQGIIDGLLDTGVASFLAGDLDEARHCFTEGLSRSRQVENRLGAARMTFQLGCVAFEAHDVSSAHELLQDAASVYQELGDRLGAAYTLGVLGYVAFEEGKAEEAKQHLEDSVRIRRDAGDDPASVADVVEALMLTAVDMGDIGAAVSLVGERIEIFRQVSGNMASFIDCLTYIALASSEPRRAWQLAGAAAAQNGSPSKHVDAFGSPKYHFPFATLKSRLEGARLQVGEQVAEEAYAEGRHMTGDQIVAYALELSTPGLH